MRDELSSCASWYAVQTQARAEWRAKQHLSMQGYRVFAPTITKRVRHARQSTMVTRPLFPGYIFVAFDIRRDRWRSINGTAGVSSLIMAGDAPVALPVGLVEAIASRQDNADGGIGRDAMRVDMPVALSRGPFADLIGRIERFDAKGRVQVLLEIMGRAVAVKTTVANLSAADT